MVMELSPGRARPAVVVPSPPAAAGDGVRLPDESMQRCDLVLIQRESDAVVRTKELTLPPPRMAKGRGWTIQSFDLRDRRDNTIDLPPAVDGMEAWLVLDRQVEDEKPDGNLRLPMPAGQGFRRQTLRVR